MMTKPIALLKDSLREAWDSKTLLVMLVPLLIAARATRESVRA
jgi:hypothetical protein